MKTEITFNNEPEKSEPCIMKSAFRFKNGKRIIVFTGNEGIKSFECDEDWNAFRQPFATSPNHGCCSATEYHLRIRKMHDAEDFVPEQSTPTRGK